MEKEKTRAERISEFAEGNNRNFNDLLSLIKAGESVRTVIIDTDDNQKKTINIKSGRLFFQFKEDEKDVSHTLGNYNKLVVESCQLVCE